MKTTHLPCLLALIVCVSFAPVVAEESDDAETPTALDRTLTLSLKSVTLQQLGDYLNKLTGVQFVIPTELREKKVPDVAFRNVTPIQVAEAIHVSSGHNISFEKFHSEYFARLYRYALTIMRGNEAAAEEIAQETLLRVARHIKPFSREDELLEAKYQKGHSVQEIAAKLGISGQAAESRLARARHRLRVTILKLMNNEPA